MPRDVAEHVDGARAAALDDAALRRARHRDAAPRRRVPARVRARLRPAARSTSSYDKPVDEGERARFRELVRERARRTRAGGAAGRRARVLVAAAARDARRAGAAARDRDARGRRARDASPIATRRSTCSTSGPARARSRSRSRSERPKARVTATDVSGRGARGRARERASARPRRIASRFLEGSLFEPVGGRALRPRRVESALRRGTRCGVARRRSCARAGAALFAGPDGTDVLRAFAAQVRRRARAGRRRAGRARPASGRRRRGVARGGGSRRRSTVHRDAAGRPRVVAARRRDG